MQKRLYRYLVRFHDLPDVYPVMADTTVEAIKKAHAVADRAHGRDPSRVCVQCDRLDPQQA